MKYLRRIKRYNRQVAKYAKKQFLSTYNTNVSRHRLARHWRAGLTGIRGFFANSALCRIEDVPSYGRKEIHFFLSA